MRKRSFLSLLTALVMLVTLLVPASFLAEGEEEAPAPVEPEQTVTEVTEPAEPEQTGEEIPEPETTGQTETEATPAEETETPDEETETPAEETETPAEETETPDEETETPAEETETPAEETETPDEETETPDEETETPDEETETPAEETEEPAGETDFEIDGDTLVRYNGQDKDVVVPAGIRVIGNSAFAFNKKIETVTLPDSVEIIAAYAFADCENLQAVILGVGSKLEEIGGHAFRNDAKLDTAFAANVERVADTAFTEPAPVETEPVETEPTEPTETEPTETEPTEPTETEPVETEPTEPTDTDEPETALAVTPVQITGQPADANAKVGGTATFTVTATGTGLTYQWQVKTSATAGWKNTTLGGATTRTLSFTVKHDYLGRQYRCVVTDSAGNVATSAAASLLEAVDVAEITRDPEDCAVEAGGTATFTVEATGEGLTYQWQVKVSAGAAWKNTTLGGANTDTLSFTAHSTYFGRQYRCIVTDTLGNTATSEPATLIKAEPALTITADPTDCEVEVNGTATFTVEATGDGLTYQWQVKVSTGAAWKNTTLGGARTATLSFTAKDDYFGRQYRCIVTDASGNTATSEGATLIRKGISLSITADPEDCETTLGGTATFTVEAAGEGLTYQWQVKTSATAGWKATTLGGAKTATLSFAAQSAYFGRQFRCVVKDASGNTVISEAATLLRAVDALVISQQPEDCETTLGGNATFTVAATGEGLTYQWQVKTSATAAWKATGLGGAKTATLSFTTESAYFGRQFRCIVRDASGNSVTSDPATLLRAVDPVEITEQPADVEAALGETVTFTVAATGTDLTYQWQVKTGATAAWKATTLTGAKTDTLSFTTQSAYFGRQFRCIVTDGSGASVTSEPATLIRFEAVEITQDPADCEVAVGEDAIFTVVAAGTDLIYQWQVKTSATADWKNTSLTGARTDTLTVTAQASYFGRQYRCLVTDSHGNTATSEPATLTELVQQFIVNQVVYSILDDVTTVAVIGYNGTAASLTIPTDVTYRDVTYRVVEIGASAFENKTGLTSISLPNSITAIRTRAFAGCTNLSSMTNHD